MSTDYLRFCFGTDEDDDQVRDTYMGGYKRPLVSTASFIIDAGFCTRIRITPRTSLHCHSFQRCFHRNSFPLTEGKREYTHTIYLLVLSGRAQCRPIYVSLWPAFCLSPFVSSVIWMQYQKFSVPKNQYFSASLVWAINLQMKKCSCFTTVF